MLNLYVKFMTDGSALHIADLKLCKKVTLKMGSLQCVEFLHAIVTIIFFFNKVIYITLYTSSL